MESKDGSDVSGGARLYHTLTACTRCRSRKTRCDAGLPKCGPCERSGAHCEFFDSAKQKTIPRSYVVHLQNKVRKLEEEVRRREAQLEESDGPTDEELIKATGAVKFGDYEHYKEPRFVGPSSGVTVTRLVLESAKNDLEPEEFKDITFQHHNAFLPQPRKDQSHARDHREVALPPRSFGEQLVRLFCRKSLYMLPVLHEPTFLAEVADVYEGSTDPFKTFKLKMVFAISLQKSSVKNADMADNYFLSGLQDLEKILEPMDHRTLQCLLVMVQYALVKPTRIAAYHIVGICVRLCIQLGYHQERTIMLSDTTLDPITKDMRRRLFWTVASMEYGLSQVLGRPSAFCTSDAYIDVRFYEPVDDSYITKEAVLPALQSKKKLISMHFFRMRRLQAEIRQTLYQNPRETPKNDEDPWFAQMFAKCAKWKASCPHDDEGSGLSEKWFNHRYNNIIIFMYRPSPQVPAPSLDATLICYSCAVENVTLEKEMCKGGTVDLTWVFMHQIYTVTLTLIWTIYNTEIRRRHPRVEVEAHIQSQVELLMSLEERWPGSAAAGDLFTRLSAAAMKNYELDIRKSPASSNRSVSANSPRNGQSSPYPRSDGNPLPADTPSPKTGIAFSSTYPSGLSHTIPPNYHQASSPESGIVQPEASVRDFQGMMSDPSFMQAMFFNMNQGSTQLQTHDYLQGWDPGPTPQHQQPSASSFPFGPPIPSPAIAAHHQPLPFPSVGYIPGTSAEVAPPLNAQAQHDELMRILEVEQMQSYGLSGGGDGVRRGTSERDQQQHPMWRFEDPGYY